MAPETLIFMPNGDVTLTLIRNVLKEEDPPSGTSLISSAHQQTANNEDRQPEAAPGVEADPPAEAEEPEESVVFFAPDPPESENFYPPPPRAARGSDASSRRDRSASPPASFWASLKRQAARMAEPGEDGHSASPPRPAKKPERIILSSHEVQCVVSSRHMMLASQYFEKMLSGNSNEATTLRTKRHVSIPLSADLDAMIILLNIVHGISRKVPRQVNLDILSKLAVLVSSLGMLEAVQFFSDTWIDNFQREGLPKSYNENVLPLLFVFWVFDRPLEFKNMTRIAQRECDEKLGGDMLEVPIPHSIIDAIKRDREFAMESAITVIHTLINKYMEGQTICDGSMDEELGYACDAMVLGSLMKSSRKIGIWPKPEAPFRGKKFKDLARAIRNIRILDVCKKSSSRRLHMLGPSSNSHGLEDSIKAAMKSIEACMDGLELSDYAKKSDDYSSDLQIFVPAPSSDELKEQTKEDTEKNVPIYMKEDVIEMPKEEVNIVQIEHSPPQATFSRPSNSRNVEEPPPTEVKVAPRQHSTDFQQQARGPARINILEAAEPVTTEEKANPRDSTSQEAKTIPTVIAKLVDGPPKEDVKVLGDRKLNRTTSFPKIPKGEVNSPLKESHLAPRVVSSEETIKEAPHLEKEEVKAPTVEVKATLSDAMTTTEDEETLVLPQNFKMRKSKKRFSAKY